VVTGLFGRDSRKEAIPSIREYPFLRKVFASMFNGAFLCFNKRPVFMMKAFGSSALLIKGFFC